MIRQNNRALYESIMKDVAKVIKRRLNEGLYDYVTTSSYEDVNSMLSKERLNNLEIHEYHEGFAVIVDRENDCMNYIDEDENLLSDMWFDECSYFSDGCGKVIKDDKINFIDKTGRMLFPEWVKMSVVDVYNFHEGFAVVKESKGQYRFNYIDKNGRLLSNQWYFDAGSFHNGFAKVSIGLNSWNYIDKKGRLLSKEWFDYCWNFGDSVDKNHAIVSKIVDEKTFKKKRFMIDKKGRLTKFDRSKQIDKPVELW